MTVCSLTSLFLMTLRQIHEKADLSIRVRRGQLLYLKEPAHHFRLLHLKLACRMRHGRTRLRVPSLSHRRLGISVQVNRDFVAASSLLRSGCACLPANGPPLSPRREMLSARRHISRRSSQNWSVMADQNPTTASTASGRSRTLISAGLAATVALVIGFGAGYALGNSGSPDDSAATSRAAPAPEPQETSAEPEAAETSAPPASDTPVALGAEVDLTAIKVTVFEYKKDIKDPDGSGPEAGTQWDAALVRACNVSLGEDDGRDLITNFGVWNLADDDDGTYGTLDLTPSPAPAPQWANFTKLNPGKCQKGWVALERPDNVTAATITYSFNGEEQARWVLD